MSGIETVDSVPGRGRPTSVVTSKITDTHRTTGCFDDRLLTMMTDTGFYVP